jgi:hypothetical protein
MYAAPADSVEIQKYITQKKHAKFSVEIRMALCTTSVHLL